ncbi:S24 family peptidase [Albidovulum sediminis]|uniref:Peptidase S24/S26A/S26B/S26C domain-containing protein n=1 Tax=Albidovulum sediminis TaxID=3066345 RepID=A0ABT2NNF5_9RHOB|nr:hypothetical protein [Defluviimonas sediminis]
MEHAEETLKRLVAQRLKALDTNAFAVETAAGLPEDTIRAILRGLKKSGTTLNKAKAVCDALDIEFHLGPRRSPEPVGIVEIEGSGFARIPLHDAWLSAGPGVENGDVAIIDHLVFRQEWLRKIDVKPEAAAMARVSGDSMAPGIQSGDLVMIDTTRREVPVYKKNRLPTRLPIFAFMQDSEARVKRLERRPKEKILVLYSDNRDMPPELIAESDAHVLNILGQVVWSGHVWR